MLDRIFNLVEKQVVLPDIVWENNSHFLYISSKHEKLCIEEEKARKKQARALGAAK